MASLRARSRKSFSTSFSKWSYVLADNKLAERAGWDAEMLALEVADLKSLGIDMIDLGFTGRELDDLLRQTDADPREDEVPTVPEVPVTRAGDLWLLGHDRLICGDATDAATVSNLNRIPPDLEKRLSVVTSFRTLGLGDIWAEVREWLEGQETSVPESLPVHPAQESNRG